MTFIDSTYGKNIPQIIAKSMQGTDDKTRELAKVSEQVNSGRRYSDTLEISQAGKLTPFIELNKQLYENERIRESNNTVATTIRATENSMDSLNKIVDKIMENLMISDGGNDMQLLRGSLGEIQNILNGRFAGKALFSGYDVNSDAVNDIVNQSNLVNGVATSNYVSSGQDKYIYTIDKAHQIQPNIVAGDECFAKIIGAIHLALQGDDQLSEAQEMLKNGQDLLQQKLTTLGNNIKLLKDSTESLEEEYSTLQNTANESFTVDTYEALARMRETEESIKISYYVTGVLSSISILNYIK